MSYIDVRHANFLPPQLTVGETRDLSPRYTTTDSLALVRDASADLVSQSRRVHVPVEEPEAPIQAAELAASKSINSSAAEAEQGADMVTKRTMTIDQFLPGARLAA